MTEKYVELRLHLYTKAFFILGNDRDQVLAKPLESRLMSIKQLFASSLMSLINTLRLLSVRIIGLISHKCSQK